MSAAAPGAECAACLSFTQVNDDRPGNVPWTDRAGATLYLHPLPIVFYNASQPSQRIVAPAHSLVMFGGDASPAPVCNDVWLSWDHGSHWHLIAGNSTRGTRGGAAAPPYDLRSFDPWLLPVTAVNTAAVVAGNASSVSVVRIGGLNADGEAVHDVFASRDLLSWPPVKAAYSAEYVQAAAVFTSDGALYLTGGQTARPPIRVSAEVWRSDDDGAHWSCVATNAAFGPRFSHSTVVLSGNQSSAVTGDAVVLVGGTDNNSMLNDVWASADGCVTWTLLTDAAAFSPRRDFSLLATADGVLLLIGGQDAASSFDSIFASFDGGYVWREFQWPHSSHHASPDSFGARHLLMAALDEGGFLYVAGGKGQHSQYLNDIFRSSISVSNTSALRAVFGLQDSRVCGTGLYCWGDTVVVDSAGLVYCANSGCSAETVSWPIFVGIVAAATTVFIAFILWRNCGGKGRRETPAGPLNEHLINPEELDE